MINMQYYAHKVSFNPLLYDGGLLWWLYILEQLKYRLWVGLDLIQYIYICFDFSYKNNILFNGFVFLIVYYYSGV